MLKRYVSKGEKRSDNMVLLMYFKRYSYQDYNLYCE